MEIFNERVQELYSIYNGLDVRTYTPYTPKFTEANTAIYSQTEKCSIEDALENLIEAEVFDRDSAVPVIKEEGHMRLTIKPKMLGGKKGISALDGNNKQVGAVTLIAGKATDNSKYEVGIKLRALKTAIDNAKGNMAGEVFLTSKMKNVDGGVNFDPTNVSDKGNLTVTTADGETVAVKIVQTARKFFKDNGRVPKICIGDKVADQLIQEVNAGMGKSKKGDYSMTANTGQGQDGFSVMIDTMNIPLEVLAPVNEYKGIVINTDSLIQFYCPTTLVMAYAVLETVDAAKQPLLVRGEFVVNYGKVDEETGRGSVHAKSAPVPMIIHNKLLHRYQLVIA